MNRFTAEHDRILVHIVDNRAQRRWTQILAAIVSIAALCVAGYLGSLL